MAAPARQYQISKLDHVEDIESYIPGGFHPVHLGDLFNDRYKIIHKLGYGDFSTVWLALDLQQHRYVALKIVRAEGSANSMELEILWRVENNPSDKPGKKHVATMFDHFTVDGPNGSHLCLVSEVAGSSVATFHDGQGQGQTKGTRRLRADLARKIAKQAVEALDFVHSCQICHGDITASNWLFRFSSLSEWSEQEVYQRLGSPQKDAVLTVSGSEPSASAPRYLVKAAKLVDPQYLEEEIMLIDFGQSFLFIAPPAKEDVSIPFSYCAPEVIFDAKVGPYAEIWALGCVLFELRAGQQLFSDWVGTQDDVLRQMVQMYGKFPEKWWSSWSQRAMFFDEDGKPKKDWGGGVPRATEYPMDEAITDIGYEDDEEQDVPRIGEAWLEKPGTRIPGKEAVLLKDILDRILKWEPEERISLQVILEHPWLNLVPEA